MNPLPNLATRLRDFAASLRQRRIALRYLPQFFGLIWRVSPAMTTASVVLRLVRAAVPASMLYVGKLLVDEIVRLLNTSPHDWSALLGSDASRLGWYIGLELALTLASDVLNRATALVDSLLGDRVANETSVRLMQHASTLDVAMFEDAEFYDKLEKARRQTTSRITLMSQTLAQVQDLVSMLLLASGLVMFAPWLLVVLVLTVIPGFLAESQFNARTYSLMNSWTPKRRELDYLRYTGASDETAKEVKIFGLSAFLTERYKTLSEVYYRDNRALAIQRALWGGVLAAVATLGYYGAYLFIVLKTVQGSISLGDMTFLAGSFRGLRGSLETVLGRFASIAESALYLKDLFEFFTLKPRIVRESRGNAHAAAPSIPRPVREGFVFDNVGFRYANAEQWSLRNISFTLHAGEKLALVGENGAGKTTLVKLMARLYDPSEGRILLDGRDLREYDPSELRNEIGVIFQDFVRYQMNARTNIAVGRISEQSDLARIDRAAAQSLADSVIATLPQGYDHLVGRRFAGGTELSGGQWQKIALARAYMRDAQLLILDEPTAALDARAEYEIFQRFAELTAGKTAVLISHRFSTVRMADRIAVLGRSSDDASSAAASNGSTLLELGSHEDLIALGGRYAELFRLQAKGYW
jgi:ATP-binding cassette subfamily B protein